MKKIIGFILVSLLIPLCLGASKEKVSVQGTPKINVLLKKDIAAVTFMSNTAKRPRLIISGRHSIIKGTGKVPAIEYNKGKVRHPGVKITGKVKKVSYINIKKDILDLLENHADITITKDTSYGTECSTHGTKAIISGMGIKHGLKKAVIGVDELNANHSTGSLKTLGTKKNPKIVVVKGATLTLTGNFNGYGVLILTGEEQPTPRPPARIKPIFPEQPGLHRIGLPRRPSIKRVSRLRMLNNAQWHGIIISDLRGRSIELRGNRYRYGHIRPIRPISPGLEQIFNKTKYRPMPAEASGVVVDGAVLLESNYANIRMDNAKIIYSPQAIQEICEKIIEPISKNQVLPLRFEKYKEIKNK